MKNMPHFRVSKGFLSSVYPDYAFNIFKKFKFKTKFGILKLKGKPCMCVYSGKSIEKNLFTPIGKIFIYCKI